MFAVGDFLLLEFGILMISKMAVSCAFACKHLCVSDGVGAYGACIIDALRMSQGTVYLITKWNFRIDYFNFVILGQKQNPS